MRRSPETALSPKCSRKPGSSNDGAAERSMSSNGATKTATRPPTWTSQASTVVATLWPVAVGNEHPSPTSQGAQSRAQSGAQSGHCRNGQGQGARHAVREAATSKEKSREKSKEKILQAIRADPAIPMAELLSRTLEQCPPPSTPKTSPGSFAPPPWTIRESTIGADEPSCGPQTTRDAFRASDP